METTAQVELTVDEFKALLARPDWKRQEECSVLDAYTVEDEIYDIETGEFVTEDIKTVHYECNKRNSIIVDGKEICVECSQNCMYDNIYDDDTFEYGSVAWYLEGFRVVDEYGDILSESDIEEIISEYGGEDFESDCKGVGAKYVNVDVDEKDNPPRYVHANRTPSYRFSGKLLAEEESSPVKGSCNFSGAWGWWQKYKLYQTKAGRFICYKELRSQWVGQKTRSWAKVAKTANGVKRFFGKGDLARRLYAEADI